MNQLLLLFKIMKGMNQDIDILSSSTDTAFRLFNIKTLTLDNSTSNALTNEKGNSLIRSINTNGESFEVSGTILGIILCTADTVVLFTYVSNTMNVIYKFTYDSNSDTLSGRILALGNFDIRSNANVSGIFVYEHSKLLKVYWVDGINLLRYINIVGKDIIKDVNRLNSSPTFKVNHHINVERIVGGGVFTAGVVQYAFTYFNKYGAETNIVDMTPLYYIGDEHRGVNNDETVGCSFKVTIENPDTSFDYIRVYSILRTSINSTAVVKIVGDIKL